MVENDFRMVNKRVILFVKRFRSKAPSVPLCPLANLETA